MPHDVCPATVWRICMALMSIKEESGVTAATQCAILMVVRYASRSWAEPALDYIELYYKALKV